MTTPTTCPRCKGHAPEPHPWSYCVAHLSARIDAIEEHPALSVPALESDPAKPPGKPDGERALAPGWVRLESPGAHPPGQPCPPNCARPTICHECNREAVFCRPSDDTGACEAHAAEMGVFVQPAPAESPGDGAWTDLGDISAVPPDRSVAMSCEKCRVRWRGCADVFECPRCGDGTPPWNPGDAFEGCDYGPPAPAAPSAEAKTCEPPGLYRKFTVMRTDGSSEPRGKHENCDYFVLDWVHDKFAPVAALAYADACQAEYPELAADLRRRAGRPMRPATAQLKAARCQVNSFDGADQCVQENGHAERHVFNRMVPPEPQPAAAPALKCSHLYCTTPGSPVGDGELFCNVCTAMCKAKVAAVEAERAMKNPAAAPAPECAGPFVDARDCPVHDPRKAAAPPSVTSEQAVSHAEARSLLTKTLFEVPASTPSFDPVAAKLKLYAYVARCESVEAALRKNVAKQRDLVFRHAKDAGESEAGRYKALAERDALRAELAEAKENVEHMEARNKEILAELSEIQVEREKYIRERVDIGNKYDLHMAECRRAELDGNRERATAAEQHSARLCKDLVALHDERDALRAELARLRDERDEVIARAKHDAPVWDRLEKIALELEAGHLAVEAKAKQTTKSPAGTGTNRERAAHIIDTQGPISNPALLRTILDEAEARGREAALPEVTAWRALDEGMRYGFITYLRTTWPNSKEAQVARRVLEALCEAPKKEGWTAVTAGPVKP